MHSASRYHAAAASAAASSDGEVREARVEMVCGGAMAGRKRFDDRRRRGRRRVIFSLYRECDDDAIGARRTKERVRDRVRTGGDGREWREEEANARTPLSVGHDEDSCERPTGGGRSDGGVNDNDDGAQSLTARRRKPTAVEGTRRCRIVRAPRIRSIAPRCHRTSARAVAARFYTPAIIDNIYTHTHTPKRNKT